MDATFDTGPTIFIAISCESARTTATTQVLVTFRRISTLFIFPPINVVIIYFTIISVLVYNINCLTLYLSNFKK